MNEAHRKKLRAQEYVIWIRIYCSNKKLQTLVERAYKVDPRVLAWKKEQERLREEKEVLEAYHDKSQRQEEEARRAEAEKKEQERLKKDQEEREAREGENENEE